MGTVIFNVLAIIIGIITIIVNIRIAKYNAGKNRIIYETEEMPVHKDRKDAFKELNDKLNTQKYTVLTVYQDKSNFSISRYVLCKIKI